MNHKYSVLIVEDEIVTAMYLKSEIKSRGFEITDIASTGEKSIEIAVDKHPSIILMDINLAGEMSGIEAAEIIMSKIKTNIVFMTGYDDELIYKKAMELQPKGFFNKPVRIRELLNVFEKI